MRKKKVGVVILAGGLSKRFGSPKQLATFRGEPMLNWACRAALELEPEQVVAILPSSLGESSMALPYGVEKFLNAHPEEGLATSIRLGLDALAKEVEVAVLALGDQPLVSGEHLRQLCTELDGSHWMAASLYPDGSLGVPAAFHRSKWARLYELRGEEGAKHVLRTVDPPPRSVPLPSGNELDIDTPDDLEI